MNMKDAALKESRFLKKAARYFIEQTVDSGAEADTLCRLFEKSDLISEVHHEKNISAFKNQAGP
jgi:hypothetical protein